MTRAIALFCGVLLIGPVVFAQNPLFIPPAIVGNQFQLDLNAGTTQFFPGNPTLTMGANGVLLGPTLVMEKNQQVTINVTNFMADHTSVHWHGLHLPAIADGGPHQIVQPGSTWSPTFTVKDKAMTAWYHPHLHHHTNEHVQKGLAGMIIIKDQIEAALPLPRTYGVDDIPLVVQTKGFDTNNQIIVETNVDSVRMVNGTLNPKVSVPAQVVRLRLLNGSSQRYYNFGFEGGKDFNMIASDGGLLDAPLNMTRLMLAPGERAEILVDFNNMQGQSIYLKSYASEFPNGIYGARRPGMGMGQVIQNYASNLLNGADFDIIRFDVGQPTANPVTSIPSALITNTPWDEALSANTRTVLFSMAPGASPVEGPYLVNNQTFDLTRIDFQVMQDDIEVWEITNMTPIGHPFHMHGFSFYVLEVNGGPPPAHMLGRKDVVHLPASQGTVKFVVKYEDYADSLTPFVFHCHMLFHEDGGMMGQYVVRPRPTSVEGPSVVGGIYPNPATNSLRLEMPISQETRFRIIDVMGREVSTGFILGNSTEVDISQLANGVYWLNLDELNYRFVKQ